MGQRLIGMETQIGVKKNRLLKWSIESTLVCTQSIMWQLVMEDWVNEMKSGAEIKWYGDTDRGGKKQVIKLMNWWSTLVCTQSYP